MDLGIFEVPYGCFPEYSYSGIFLFRNILIPEYP